jgi:hypothetical protein
MTRIKHELMENELTIAKGNNGKTVVTLTKENYTQNENSFIQEDQCTRLNNNPTQNYRKL